MTVLSGSRAAEATAMPDPVLVLNAGSSSIKFALFRPQGGDLDEIARGLFEGIGGNPRFSARGPDGTKLAERSWPAAEAPKTHRSAMRVLGSWIREFLNGGGVAAVGHRVVHGGPGFAQPVVIDADTLDRLDDLIPLAPLHQPHNLRAIEAVAVGYPGVPQVACFDTSFHRNHPWVADTFGLPGQYYDAGVRRYGFHGLSYEYIAEELRHIAPALATGKVVVAHLGNGASMCAIHGGRSVDSTMGFTAVDGLPMGTRCGQIDPGVILHLIDRLGLTTAQVSDLIYTGSGLKGMSGVSNDMRELLASEEEAAKRAVAYFVYRIRRELGALAAAMQGIDGLVFTGGIGENAAPIRAMVCADQAWLGIALDEAANADDGPLISIGPTQVWVIRTNEEKMIARHTLAALAR
jgi:acetate kinase